MDLKFRATIEKVVFGKATKILLDVADDNEIEAAQLTAAKGQSLAFSVELPQVHD